VTRVVDRKVSRGQPYLVVDGGLHHQLADKVLLPDVQVDDLIVIFQAGAYGLTASPTAFLGPAEVLV
jgi:diaminopimelate decarboxylase